MNIYGSLFVCMLETVLKGVFYERERVRMGNGRQVRRRKRQVLVTISSSLLRSGGDQVKFLFLFCFFSWRCITSYLNSWMWLSRLGPKPFIKGLYLRKLMLFQNVKTFSSSCYSSKYGPYSFIFWVYKMSVYKTSFLCVTTSYWLSLVRGITQHNV